MSALIHTPDEKALRVHTGCKPRQLRSLSPPPPPPCARISRASTPLVHREGGEKFNYKKVLAFRQFGFSRDISSRISPHSLSISIFRSVFILRFLISPFYPCPSPSPPSHRSLSLSFSRGRQPRYGRARICGLFEPASNHTHPRHPRGPSLPPRPRWPPTLFIKRRYIIFY